MTNETGRRDLLVRDGAGDVIVREVVRMVMFFNTPLASMRETARRAIVDFVSLVTLDAFPYYDPDPEGERQELTQQAFDDLIHLWFRGKFSTWPNASIELTGPTGLAPEYGLQYWGKALGLPGLPDDVGFLHVWMPRDWFLRNAKSVGGYFRSTAAQSPTSAAYVNMALSGGTMRARQALARRYAGVDIAEPSAVSLDLGLKVPGAYWINYLGAELADRTGGHQSLQDALPADAVVESLPGGGVLARLTRDLQLGDRNRREELPAYRAFARFMDARGLLHVPRKVAYFQDEEGMADRSAQEAWHRRFLEPPS